MGENSVVLPEFVSQLDAVPDGTPVCSFAFPALTCRAFLCRRFVAEYFRFRGQTISTTGLGAIISQATDSGNFRLLLAATAVMAVMVVTINRLVWRPLYALASTRFKLDSNRATGSIRGIFQEYAI